MLLAEPALIIQYPILTFIKRARFLSMRDTVKPLQLFIIYITVARRDQGSIVQGAIQRHSKRQPLTPKG